MPVGRVNYKGPIAIGRTNPVALGTLATRAAAKAGLGRSAGKSAKTSPVVQQQQDLAMAKALGLKGAKDAKIASKGRHNAPVVKGKSNALEAKANNGSKTRVPKSRADTGTSGKRRRA